MFIIKYRTLYRVKKDSSDGKIVKGDMVYRDVYTKKIVVENDKYLKNYTEDDFVSDFEAKDISYKYQLLEFNYCNRCEWVLKGTIKITEEDPNED